MMKQIKWIMLVLVMGSLTVAPVASANGKAKLPPPPQPDTIESVDAANFSVKVSTGQDKNRQTVAYTITAFTKIYINDKPSKLEDLQKGMRVSVTDSNKTATRIDAVDAPVKSTDKKKK